MRNAYTILVGKSEGKRTHGRPRRRWEDNIRMYLRAIGCKRCEMYSSGSGYGPTVSSKKVGDFLNRLSDY